MEFSGWNTGVGSLSLFQGIFPTQESNPGLLHCRRVLYQLSHQREALVSTPSDTNGQENVRTVLSFYKLTFQCLNPRLSLLRGAAEC